MIGDRQELERYLGDIHPEAMLADGLEDALIGVAYRAGMSAVALYDRDRCLEVLVRDSGMTEAMAEEWMTANAEGSWVGPGTPIFCELLPGINNET